MEIIEQSQLKDADEGGKRLDTGREGQVLGEGRPSAVSKRRVCAATMVFFDSCSVVDVVYVLW